LADPGGRTDGLHGFKSRNEEWSRPLEPARRKRNPGAVASCDDRMWVWSGPTPRSPKPARTLDRNERTADAYL